MATSQHSLEPVVGWEQLPQGFVHRDGSDLAIDSDDRIYLLTVFDSRVIVYERTGEFVTSWGENTLSDDPHGISVGPDDSIYVADRGAHVVRKFTRDGVQLAVIGIEGVASDTGFDPAVTDRFEREARMRSGPPFNRPTKVAIGPNGDIFVADGYGNARIHRFSPDGTLLQSWGEVGPAAGQFRIPHSVLVTPDERLLVADRENGRIQVFTLDGELLEVWNDVQRPECFTLDSQGRLYVGAAPDGPPYPSMAYRGTESRVARVSILDQEGRVLESLEGGPPGDCGPGNFMSVEGVAIDSQGDVYICQNAESSSRALGLKYDPACPVIQKLTRRR